jgi:maltose O-acetyltransferase
MVVMTEKAKGDCGALYNAIFDEKLIAERRHCKGVCARFNNTDPNDIEAQTAILRELLGHLSENVAICAPFFCDYGYNIYLGHHVEINHNVVILDGAPVTVGHYVLIGPNCTIATAGHPLDVNLRRQGLEFALPITIKDDVWIGSNVAIMPGITISENSVIGAGSVVTKDIPPNVVAVGAPCRPIRKIPNCITSNSAIEQRDDNL